jgi:hypothetical protein
MGRKKNEEIGEAPNEKYCKRLVELAFPLAPTDAMTSLKVEIEKKQHTRAELRERLSKDPELEWRLRKLYRHDPEPVSLEELVEVAFMLRATIEEEEYTRAGLHAALQRHRKLVAKLERRYHHDGKKWTLERLVEVAFLPKITIGTEEFTKLGLQLELPKNPKLQQRVAVRVHFVPSKWLLEQELESRRKWSAEHGGDIYNFVAGEGLTGVCFSGGGIRSATFNLGIIQGLAQVGLLPWIDYLSSVSGGGYIHEFLAAWILRNERGRQGVIDELIPQAEPGCLPRAPEPVRWLMRYASYLTPMRGPFSTDTWTMAAIWFRNTILNQIPILAGLGFVFLFIHLLVLTPMQRKSDFWTWQGASGSSLWCWLQVIGALAVSAAFLSVIRLGRNLRHQRDMHDPDPYANTASMTAASLLSNGQVQLQLILPWLVLSVWLSYWTQLRLNANCPVFWLGLIPAGVWILSIVMVVIFAGGAVDAYGRLHSRDAHNAYESRHAGPGLTRKIFAGLGFVALGLLAVLVACGLGWAFVLGSSWIAQQISSLVGLVDAAKQTAQQTLQFSVSGTAEAFQANLSGSLNGKGSAVGGYIIDPWRIELALLPGLLLSVPYVAIELTLGLVGRDFSDMRREWLARLRAWSLLYALLWFGLVCLALLGPYLVYWIIGEGKIATWSAVVTFVAAHGSMIFAGWSGKADGKPTDDGILGFKPLDLLALVAAPITVLGLLIAVSFCMSWGMDHVPLAWLGGHYWLADLLCCLAAGLVAVLFGWRVDINEFSMMSFYRNRLTRCYLGASTPERQADPFTGFDGRAELMLLNGKTQRAMPKVRDLLPKEYVATERDRDGNEVKGQYDGPFPIFCTTLNLTTGEDLATQERKGTSFAFTPLYSGYSVAWTDAHRASDVSYNGYVPTEDFAYSEQGISLDTAVAISGAAVNPNMGYNSNPALAFLMTFFNVRLGWWISNPRKKDRWTASENRATPKFAAWYLFRELFGKVNDAAPYVNLSDGGHFENMGLYELVRRRCKYIVVCDAEEDPDMTFEGMGAAITKCRADFGADIDLDLRPLQKQPDTGYSKAHCVVGKIQYPPPPGEPSDCGCRTDCECLGDADDDPYTGIVVYIKSSLVGDEPPDLLTYQLKHAVFPQDSTADQWFQETQFEAYRRLGHHVAMATFPPALSPDATSVKSKQDLRDLFRRLYQIWYPRTPEMEKYLTDHLKQYEAILKELRERKELVGLEARLNDPTEWSVTKVVTWNVPEGDALGVLYPGQFANSLIDFMYRIYTDLQLAFPDNRVSPHAVWWICLFRRWCRVTLLRDTWRVHVAGYPLEFQLFARRELNLPEV